MNGDLLAPNGLSRGASVRPEDIAPRVIYQIIDPQTGITRALSPIDQPPDQYVTCEEILLAGNNKAHWSQFNPGNFNFVMNRLAQGDNTPINFTAQTSLAASYGYMQIMYVTAIGTMGWSGVQSGAQNPSYLFDTPANLQIGGGSLELGNSYLRRLFRHEDPADAAKPAFDAQSDLEDVFVAVWGDYNGNKTTYPQSVLGKTRHYPPQSDPANPKPIFTSP